jgi:hypothetical protein
MNSKEKEAVNHLPPGWDKVFELLLSRLEDIELQVYNHIPTEIKHVNNRLNKMLWWLLGSLVTLNAALILLILRPWV